MYYVKTYITLKQILFSMVLYYVIQGSKSYKGKDTNYLQDVLERRKQSLEALHEECLQTCQLTHILPLYKTPALIYHTSRSKY